MGWVEALEERKEQEINVYLLSFLCSWVETTLVYLRGGGEVDSSYPIRGLLLVMVRVVVVEKEKN